MWWMCLPPGVMFLNGPRFARIAWVITRTVPKVVPNATALISRRSSRRLLNAALYAF
jgi:hypothetical protein